MPPQSTKCCVRASQQPAPGRRQPQPSRGQPQGSGARRLPERMRVGVSGERPILGTPPGSGLTSNLGVTSYLPQERTEYSQIGCQGPCRRDPVSLSFPWVLTAPPAWLRGDLWCTTGGFHRDLASSCQARFLHVHARGACAVACRQDLGGSPGCAPQYV